MPSVALALAALSAAGCGSGGGSSDARPVDDAAVPADASPRAEVVWQLVVEDVPHKVVGMGPLGEDIVLMGNEIVVVSTAGELVDRRRMEESFWFDGAAFGDFFLLQREEEGMSKVSRFDQSLELVGDAESPSGATTLEVWAPGTPSTWFLAQHSVNLVSSVKLAELPGMAEARSWNYPDWPAVVSPRAGLVTASGVPVFFAYCAVGSTPTACALRADPSTGELSSVEVESGKVIQKAWMAETPAGVLVLYRRKDSAFNEPPAASFHGVLLDPDGPTILAGPSLLFTDPLDLDIDGLTVLGDRAYSGGLDHLFAFDVSTLSGWTRYTLSFPPEADYQGSYALAAIDGSLYRQVSYWTPYGNQRELLIQKLVPP